MSEPLTVREAPASYQVVLETQRIRPGYKQTEVGVIPEDWDVHQLGELLANAPAYGIGAAAIPFDSSYPTYLRITDISEDGRFLDESKASVKHPLATSYMLSEGDLVLARTGASVGKSYLCDRRDGELVFAGFLIRARPNTEKLEPRYLKYFTHSRPYWNWIKVNSMRSGQPGINGREYASLRIPLPPTKAEQEAIAEALSDADALIEALEQVIAKKRHLKQGTMQELLSGKKRLPGFSGEWEMKRLGDVIEKFVGGGTPSRSNPQYWGNEIPWVTVKDFATFDPLSAQEAITKTGLQSSASHLILKGILITSTRMALGKAVVYEVDVAINQDLKALFPKPVLATQYLYFWFQYHGQSIDELGSGSTVKGISLPDLKKIEFTLPLIPEQTAIATILSDMDAEIAALETRLTKTRELKQGMMHNLLTGKIRLI